MAPALIAVFAIAATVAAQGPAKRVWSAKQLEHQEIWLRGQCTVHKPVREARIAVTCDNRAEVFVNGKLVGTADDWQKLTMIDVTDVLHPGKNTVAVHAVNEGSAAALALWLNWTDAAGDAGELVTDATWRVSEAVVDGWQKPGFDDSKWQAAAVLAETPYGMNVHGGMPTAIVHVGPIHDATEAIAEALEAVRSSRDSDEALPALDRIERAVMEARRRLWEQRRLREADSQRTRDTDK